MDLLPGLICNNAEIFTIGDPIGGEIYVVVGGARIPLSESPAHIIEAIDNSMNAADHACLDDWGIFDKMARREQWARCNCGAYNHAPDFVAGQMVMQREFVQCPSRKKCKYNSEFCRTQEQLTGLTCREIQYIVWTVKGLLDKEIAQVMGVSTETVRSHSQNIRIKTGQARKADLVRYAQKRNLIIETDELSNPNRS